jgi:hypothetical protein
LTLALLDGCLNILNERIARPAARRPSRGNGRLRLAACIAGAISRLAFILIYGTLDATDRSPASAALGYDIAPDRDRGRTAVIPAEPLLPRLCTS